jgi:hypothetical protein
MGFIGDIWDILIPKQQLILNLIDRYGHQQ